MDDGKQQKAFLPQSILLPGPGRNHANGGGEKENDDNLVLFGLFPSAPIRILWRRGSCVYTGQKEEEGVERWAGIGNATHPWFFGGGACGVLYMV